MKAFKFYDFKYPDDMREIINYLKRHGEINVNFMKLEELYEDFSDDVYCTQWMTVSDETLRRFAEYLADIEVKYYLKSRLKRE